MRSLLLFTFLIVIVLQGCNKSPGHSATIEGTFSNSPNLFLKVYNLLPDGSQLIDSVKTDSRGNFNFQIDLKETAFYLLQRDVQNKVTMVVSPGENIRITGDGGNLQKAYFIEGSDNSKLYAEYFRFTVQNLEKVDSLAKVFAESQSKPDFQKIKKGLDATYLAIFDDQKRKVVNFVNNHLQSLTSLFVISDNFGPNQLVSETGDLELFLALDSALMLNYKNNNLVKDFHLRMQDVRGLIDNKKLSDQTLKPGMAASEIALPDARGKITKLSLLKGKLTLLYFWASWSAPCRKTNMELSVLYSEFHHRGFEIFSVSVDTDADQWEKACHLDRAYWIQVNDLKGLNSDYGKLYGVQSLPTLILVGKDGKIILTGHSVDDIKSLISSNI